MIGWNFSIYRKKTSRDILADISTLEGPCLAEWQTGSDGLNWIRLLVDEKKAIDLGGNGYPYRFTAPVKVLWPYINKPPVALESWLYQPTDIITSMWKGKTVVVKDELGRCTEEEWLVIEAWDES